MPPSLLPSPRDSETEVGSGDTTLAPLLPRSDPALTRSEATTRTRTPLQSQRGACPTRHIARASGQHGRGDFISAPVGAQRLAHAAREMASLALRNLSRRVSDAQSKHRNATSMPIHSSGTRVLTLFFRYLPLKGGAV